MYLPSLTVIDPESEIVIEESPVKSKWHWKGRRKGKGSRAIPRSEWVITIGLEVEGQRIPQIEQSLRFGDRWVWKHHPSWLGDSLDSQIGTMRRRYKKLKKSLKKRK